MSAGRGGGRSFLWFQISVPDNSDLLRFGSLSIKPAGIVAAQPFGLRRKFSATMVHMPERLGWGRRGGDSVPE